MEDYQKRMIEEFKELNDRIVKLEHFLEAPEMKEIRATVCTVKCAIPDINARMTDVEESVSDIISTILG